MERTTYIEPIQCKLSSCVWPLFSCSVARSRAKLEIETHPTDSFSYTPTIDLGVLYLYANKFMRRKRHLPLTFFHRNLIFCHRHFGRHNPLTMPLLPRFHCRRFSNPPGRLFDDRRHRHREFHGSSMMSFPYLYFYYYYSYSIHQQHLCSDSTT